MKILVALKQVPDTETKIKVAADGRSLDPADVKWITSPYDEYALEEALRLKEAKGAEVVAVSVGEDKAKDVLRNALALGADQAVLRQGHRDRRSPGRGPDPGRLRRGQGLRSAPLRQQGLRRGQRRRGLHGGRAAGPGPGQPGHQAGTGRRHLPGRARGRRRHRDRGGLPARRDHRPARPERAPLRQPQGHHGRQEEAHRGSGRRRRHRRRPVCPPWPCPPPAPRAASWKGMPPAQAAALLGLLKDEAKVL